MAQVARREDLLDREGCRQQVERGETLAGASDLSRDIVAGAELGREVGRELVADHEARRGQRLDPREHGLEEELVVAGRGVDRVRALLECDEVGDRTLGNRAHHHAQVGEPAHEQRVAGAQHVGGRRRQLGERDHERRRVLAPVRPGVGGVEEVQHDGNLGARLRDLGVALVEHGRAQPRREPPHALAAGLTAPREGAGDHTRTFDEPDAEGVRGHARTSRQVTGAKRSCATLAQLEYPGSRPLGSGDGHSCDRR